MRACPKGAILTHGDLARVLDVIDYAAVMIDAEIRGVEGSSEPRYQRFEQRRLSKLMAQIASLAAGSRKPGAAA